MGSGRAIDRKWVWEWRRWCYDQGTLTFFVMTTVLLTAHIGANGRLQIDVPTDLYNTDVEIALTLQPLPSDDRWPDNFFTEIIGGWVGESLQRPEPLPDDDRQSLTFGE